jgi:ketosteroid isomerase-like protein
VPDNVKLAKRSFDAFKRGDVEDYISFFSADAEWRVSAFVTGRDAYRGHAGFREFFEEVARLSEDQGEEFVSNLEEFRDAGDGRVLALGHGAIKRERDPLEFEVGVVYTFDDGKITLLEGFTSHDEALKAAGLLT